MKKAIAVCGADRRCLESVRPTSAQLSTLASRIHSNGDPVDLEAGFVCLGVVDLGGDHEDIVRAAGSQIINQPGRFLQLVKSYRRESASLYTMLPLETVDDPDRQAEMLQARLEAVQSVNVPDLAQERSRAIDALEEALKAMSTP